MDRDVCDDAEGAEELTSLVSIYISGVDGESEFIMTSRNTKCLLEFLHRWDHEGSCVTLIFLLGNEEPIDGGEGVYKWLADNSSD